ncbi:CarboxypepD_reg-like domain-containing protein [Prevotellaceae bacterium MN60]|nr:CarboxypepD_reg-like domain-containing protein [Prevotellaceae bacterium MN60]
MKKIGLIVFFLLLLIIPACAQDVIRGHVVDEATGEGIGFASVQYKGINLVTVTDPQGRFTIRLLKGKKLTISVLGYKTRTIDVTDDSEKLFVSMRQDTKSLKEVTVNKKRTRYSRKNNPAVELMKRVIAQKKRTDLGRRDYYQYQKYQKLTLALNDVNPELLMNPKLSKFPWLVNQVETNELTGKLILPVSVDETVTQKIYRRSPRDEKNIVKGQRSSGINDFFQTGEILNTVTKDVFTDINIYDDQVRILQHPFMSPIADGAISFYRYYIEDTLLVERDSCIHLHFLPNNQQDFGFRGDLYVLKDSSCQVKRCELILPNQTDVNFVENLKLVQEFTQLPTGEWVLSVDDMIVEMVLFDFMQKGVAIKTTRLSDYSFDEIPKQLFRGKAKTKVEPDAELMGDDFWKQNRKVRLTKSENSMGDFLNSMQHTGGFKYILWTMKLLVENYIETARESKVDIGPVNTMVSTNFIDGFRTRLSAQTTANLSRHLFWKGYVARGWKSKNNYYSSAFTWSLNKKKYLPDEFPKRNITLLSTYDVISPSDKFLSTDKDNVFTALKWAKVDKMMFYNRQQLTLEREEEWGLRTLLSLKTEENEAAGNMQFVPLSSLVGAGERGAASDEAVGARNVSALELSSYHRTSVPPYPRNTSIKFRTTEIRAEIEYSPGALYVNSKNRRHKVNREAPIITLSHTAGFKGLLGGDYAYNYSEASIFKRFWFGSWGRIDFYTRAGVQWNQVPFPLLCMPAANMSYISHKQTFNLLTNMEFLNDRFVSVDFNWDMQGKLFNRIPLIKKLRWREYIGAKMLWGALSDKNNPYLEQNANSDVLMLFPDKSGLMNPRVPYWEISLGIRSIFRFFQVEYVRRMNYNDGRYGPKNSVRFGFTLMF